jgi:hypothetical protein
MTVLPLGRTKTQRLILIVMQFFDNLFSPYGLRAVYAGVILGHWAAQKSSTSPMEKSAGKRDSCRSAAPTGGWRMTGPSGPVRKETERTCSITETTF